MKYNVIYKHPEKGDCVIATLQAADDKIANKLARDLFCGGDPAIRKHTSAKKAKS